MTSKSQRFDLFFMFLGVLVGFVALVGVASFPLGNLTLSIVSGTTLTIQGFRVHHWLIGIACSVVGWLLKGKFGSLILGIGIAFIVDDLGDLGGM